MRCPLVTVKPAAIPALAELISGRHRAGSPAKPGRTTKETTIRQYLRNAITTGPASGTACSWRRGGSAYRAARAGPAAPVRRLARLLFRQAGRLAQRAGRWSTARPQPPHGYRAHRAPAGHEALADDGAAADQALAATRTEPDNMSTFSAAPL